MIYSLAALMVSKSVQQLQGHSTGSSRQPLWMLVAIIVGLKFVIAEPQISLFTAFTLYLLSGPIWWVVRRSRRLRRSGLAAAASAGRESAASS